MPLPSKFITLKKKNFSLFYLQIFPALFKLFSLFLEQFGCEFWVDIYQLCLPSDKPWFCKSSFVYYSTILYMQIIHFDHSYPHPVLSPLKPSPPHLFSSYISLVSFCDHSVSLGQSEWLWVWKYLLDPGGLPDRYIAEDNDHPFSSSQ